jgi:transposase
MLLRSISGIGGIVACEVLCELGDLHGFRSVKHLAGYVGIAPGIHQSGDNLRTTSITGRAHRLIRSYFIEASWQAIRTGPVMQAYYRKHTGKNVKSIRVKFGSRLK